MKTAWPSLIAISLVASPALAEEESAKPAEPKDAAQPQEPFAKDFDGVAQYIDLIEAKYLPADAEGRNAGVEIKFNLYPPIPRGTKVTLGFEYQSLDFDNFDYVVQDDNRKGLTAVWKPERRLGTGEYSLVARIHLEKQTPAVQKLLGNIEGLPVNLEPWVVRNPLKPIPVGTPEDKAREAKDICAFYESMMDKLVHNMGEFTATMKEVKAGNKFVAEGVLDVAALKGFITEWRKMQGEIQKEILGFQVTEPALFEQSKTAHLKLIELGRMVSKRAVQVQKEVLEQYRITEELNPQDHPYFDAGHRFRVSPDQLNKRLEAIATEACPEKKKEDESKQGDEAAKKKTPEAAEPEKPKTPKKKRKTNQEGQAAGHPRTIPG